MKKTVLGLIFFIIATLSVSAQYFDVGVGLGGKKSSYNFNQVYTEGDFPFKESFGGFIMGLGLKGGFGPLGNMPVYIVAEAEGSMDSEFHSHTENSVYFSGLIGAGVVFYPKSYLQMGISLGALWTSSDLNVPEKNTHDYEAGAAFTWDISAAFCINLSDYFGEKPLFGDELLIGLKYSGAINKFTYNYSDYSSYSPLFSRNGGGTRLVSYYSLFVKGAIRKKTKKEIAVWAEKAEKEKSEREKQRRERLVAEERGRQLSAIEREEIRRQVREELQSAYPGIDGAIVRAGQKLINGLPERAVVAVINILSNNAEMSDYVAEGLEYQLVGSNKFRIVNRTRLDTIRAEKNFQMSGEVSDESAVSIGQMLGANIVLTGSISGVGSSPTLSISALDVRTGEIVSMVREEF